MAQTVLVVEDEYKLARRGQRREPAVLGPLGVRLAAAFVGVALAAVAVFAAVVLLADRNDVSGLAANERHRETAAMVGALENAYRAAGRWDGADLQPAVALSDAAGAGATVTDLDGNVILRAGPPGAFADRHAASADSEVVVGGKPVGRLHVAFPSGGLASSERHLRTSLAEAVWLSAAVAAAGALAVALVVARSLVRPIRRLSRAAKALESGNGGGGGEREIRVGPLGGPGELGDLARTFDEMAASLRRQDQLRRALVADVAHELRTPIAVLQAETEALVDGVSDPTPAALASLHDEAVRVGRMVDDLQTLASAEAAGLHLQRRPLDLARVASEAADSLAGRYESGEVSLIEELPPTFVIGDPFRLHQVVVNLLANAAKFTPAGGRVHLAVRPVGGDAVLTVADTGPGVPDEEKPKVWDRFFRGAAGRSTGGSGIGLAVVKELVGAHGGTVSLTSPPQGGATFEVRLPLAAGDAEPAE